MKRCPECGTEEFYVLENSVVRFKAHTTAYPGQRASFVGIYANGPIVGYECAGCGQSFKTWGDIPEGTANV